MSRTTSAAAVVATAALALTGCSSGSGVQATPAPTTTTAPATTPAATTPATVALLTASAVQVKGTQGPLSYDVSLPQLTGGDPTSAQAFNDGMHAALQDEIDGYADDPTGGTTPATLTDARSTVTHIGSRVASGLLQTALDTGGAHPLVTDATVTIDLDDATPITLGDLFADEQTGLQRLAEVVPPLIAAQQPQLQIPSVDSNPSGTDPTEANYASWQATPQGMQLVFGDYQLGPRGVITVTIPWTSLTDVVDPDVLPVVTS